MPSSTLTSAPVRRRPHGLAVLMLGALASATACSAVEGKSAGSAATTASAIAAPRTTASAPPPTPLPVSDDVPPTGAVSLALADRGDLGEIVVDGTGRTVYAFSGDRPGQPTCYDACAATWPPILDHDHPASGIGIDVAEARTAPRRDGTSQVTYFGMPLYHYAGDASDEDANGQGFQLFGGGWRVIAKNGRPLA